MKRVGGISIIGPALYYTCHIEFKKKEQIDEGPLCTYTKKNIYWVMKTTTRIPFLFLYAGE